MGSDMIMTLQTVKHTKKLKEEERVSENDHRVHNIKT